MRVKSRFVYLLTIGLALTFLSMGLKSLLSPDEIEDAISGSLLINHFIQPTSIVLLLLGIHDCIVAGLLLLRIFPKIVTIYTVIWISIVIIVFVAHGDLDGMLDALEHASPLAIAIYLSVYANKKDKKTSN